MSYFDVVLETLQGIQKELKATRHAILHQTKLLQESKETPKEAAPAPKEITWQEAVRTLRNICEGQKDCIGCIVRKWCDDALGEDDAECRKIPANWEVPADE